MLADVLPFSFVFDFVKNQIVQTVYNMTLKLEEQYTGNSAEQGESSQERDQAYQTINAPHPSD